MPTSWLAASRWRNFCSSLVFAKGYFKIRVTTVFLLMFWHLLNAHIVGRRMSKVLALEKSRQVSQVAVPLVRTSILAPVFLVAIIRIDYKELCWGSREGIRNQSDERRRITLKPVWREGWMSPMETSVNLQYSAKMQTWTVYGST